MTDADARIKSLEDQVERLHNALQARGVNTKGTTDIFGRPFVLPVDDQHKATIFSTASLFSVAQPHMRGFWASTFGFFSTFFSTFAAAPLMAYIKKESSLNLENGDIVNSAIASVAGTIAMRVITGGLCDKLGARKAFIFLLLLACPGIIGIMFVQGATGFIICRFIIGLGLATFVTCQVWSTQLFNKAVVGAANATCGGWGNLGGGITNLLMPFVMVFFLGLTDEDEDKSWRLCYLLPLAMHLGSAAFILSGRDLPDGNYSELEASGAKQKSQGNIAMKTGFSNTNAWVMTLTYGFCFGVELTMTNIAALYFYTDHGLSPQMAGIFASIFGLMNLFARSLGGIVSDAANKRYGMRGRIWAMFIVQVVEGVFCLLMGVVTLSYDSPDGTRPKVMGTFYEQQDNELFDTKYNLCPGVKKYMIPSCGTWNQQVKKISKICQYTDMLPSEIPAFLLERSSATLEHIPEENRTLITYTDYDLPKFILTGDDANGECIRNQDLVGIVVLIMVCFSVCVQMAEGLHFGVVPYISRPALGIVSGMVGAGGNAGAVLTLWTIFKNDNVERTDEGFVILGIVVMVTSLVMFLIYFPNEGGMLFKAGSLKYDPQLYKPPADYRGSDVMDYSNVDGAKSKTKPNQDL